MGLDRFNKTPCGFCFVEYYSHQDALDCMKYIGGTKLDERIIRTDLDPGFQEGRQYGCAFYLSQAGSTSPILTFIPIGEANLVVKCAMNTVMSMILGEEATAARLRRNARKRRRNMGKVDNGLAKISDLA